MIALPNFGAAVIPAEKLVNYVLNPDHAEGKHKAKVFKEVLAIERRHASALAALIQSTLAGAPAEEDGADEHGVRWTTYHRIIGFNSQSAIVTVGWIFRRIAVDVPSLVSCYIELDKQEVLRLRYFAE